MKVQKLHYSLSSWFVVALLLIVAVSLPAQATVVDSSLNRFQAYAEPLFNSAGNKIGIEVHYSIGALFDAPGRPSHYSAVCLKQGALSGSPCIDRSSAIRVWTSTSGATGSWRSRNILMNCSAGANALVQIHQPYLSPPGSVLKSSRNGNPAYINGQLFYTGSSDSIKLKISGCQQQ